MSIEMLAGPSTLRASGTAAPERKASCVHRILVVDDEESVRLSLSSYLEGHGYEVDAVADAVSAVECLQSADYDLVLSDISMPDVSGLDLLATIRASHPGIEVIMITGYLDVSFAIQAMRCGAYDYFTKPFNYEKLVLTIGRVEEKRRLEAQAQEARRLSHQSAVMERAVVETALALGRAVEERDRYNIGHGKRTAEYAVLLAEEMGMADDEIRMLRHAALLHDVGKLGIDDRILNKPGPLDPDEYEAIRRHPEIGEYIIAPVSFLGTVRSTIRHHHERWDGTGYPDKLKGDEIPLAARIVCLADFFDSVTSARPYRRPMDTTEARALIEQESGSIFDPTLVHMFLRALDRLL